MRGLVLTAVLLIALPVASAHQHFTAATSQRSTPIELAAPADEVQRGPIPPRAIGDLERWFTRDESVQEQLTPQRSPRPQADEPTVAERVPRRGPPAVLPYALTFTGDGKVTGTFAGIRVHGSHEGTPVEGVFTLTVQGQALVLGTYECLAWECSVVGREVLGRTNSFLMYGLTLPGTFTGTLRGLYPSRAAWLSTLNRWAETRLGSSQADEILLAARGK